MEVRAAGGRVAVVVAVMAAILFALLVGLSLDRGEPAWTDHGRVVCPPAEACYFEDRRFYEPEPAPAPPGELPVRQSPAGP